MIRFIISILLFLTIAASAQDVHPDVRKLRTLFQSFSYSEVISLSDSLLNHPESHPKKDLIEVYLYRAASYFNLWKEKKAENAFLKLLANDRDYELDRSVFSPKLITFFNGIKQEYWKNTPEIDSLQAGTDSTVIITEAGKGNCSGSREKYSAARQYVL